MIVFLDVRTADEHGYDDLGSALNIPHDEVPSRLGELIGSEKSLFFAALEPELNMQQKYF